MASVPADHPYLRSLAAPGVRILTETPPPGLRPGQWWPSPMFSPEWIHSHADDFDVFHLHFGMETFGVAHLRDVLDALAEVRRPVVHTVHDLVNPQLIDQTVHEQQLEVLIPAASALITLTPGAAAEIRRRWDREAVVIRHPQIVPPTFDLPMAATVGHAVGRPGLLIGMYLKDLRPNIDALESTRALIAAVELLTAAGTDAGCRIEMNLRTRDEQLAERITELCAVSDRAELRRRARPSDVDLFSSVLELDLCLLPYAFGTHSGWLEMCWDLGVPALVPTTGHYAEQHPDPEFCRAVSPRNATELADAAAQLCGAGAVAGTARRRDLQVGRRRERMAEQPRLADAATQVYRRVLTESLA